MIHDPLIRSLRYMNKEYLDIMRSSFVFFSYSFHFIFFFQCLDK